METSKIVHNATLSIWQIFFLAFVCCLVLANMYAAQPILSEIAQTTGISISNSGIIITLAQVGYCLGVLLLVPLGDALENRKLITLLFAGLVLTLFIISQAINKSTLLFAFLLLGLNASLVQIIIPYSANLIEKAQKGKMIGFIVSGASMGIVLGRPISSMLTDIWGWQTTFLISSVLLIVAGLIFRSFLPARMPAKTKLAYTVILRSMARLFISLPSLRLYIFMMTLIFTSFTLFWATVPIVLQNELHFPHAKIALFSLASLAAPLCVIAGGIFADKGYRFTIIGIGTVMALCAFLISPLFGISAVGLVITVLLLDSGVNTANVLIQQTVLMMQPEAGSRLNALCISIAFIGGALGSFLGPWIYENYTWHTTSIIGLCLSGTALFIYIHLKRMNYQSNN